MRQFNLWKTGTQTVFGEGRKAARVMLVAMGMLVRDLSRVRERLYS